MYTRTLASVIHRVNQSFPVLLVTGPRQVGKTTLLQLCADPQRSYVTLDDLRVCEHDLLERDIFYRSYIQTYIQRDVNDILNISDATIFYKFLCVLAARTGQLLNYTNLASEVGIDGKTAKSWLSVLETSDLIYLLQPYYTNSYQKAY